MHQRNKATIAGQTDTSPDRMEGGSADDSPEVGSGVEVASKDDTFLDDEDYHETNSRIVSAFRCGYLPGVSGVNLAHQTNVSRCLCALSGQRIFNATWLVY